MPVCQAGGLGPELACVQLKQGILSMRSSIILTGLVLILTQPVFAEEYNKTYANSSTIHLSCMYANTAFPKSPSKIFSDVKRVLVAVDYQVNPELKTIQMDDSEQLKTLFYKPYLEQMMKSIYQKRYKDLGVENSEKGCYGRHDQPVDVISLVNKNDKEKALKLSHNPNHLTAYLSIYRKTKDIFILKVVNYRPHIDQSFLRQIFGLPQNFFDYAGSIYELDFSKAAANKENLEELIYSFISEQIQ